MTKLHRSEGDINISGQRDKWQEANIHAQTRSLLERDARCFLKQSLSTPCLNALRACAGIYIEDMEGRRYMDFHGNNVHQVGFGNAEVVAAVKRQLDELPFCTRRYTNHVAIELAERLTALADFKYENADYDQIINVAREDDEYIVRPAVQYVFNDLLMAEIAYMYDTRDSSYDIFDFDSNTIYLHLNLAL